MSELAVEPAPAVRFVFDLPSGFVELPIREDDLREENLDHLVTSVAGVFGLEPAGDDAIQAALGLAAVGAAVGDRGVDYAAAGFYRSPDDADRPIMILVTSIGMDSEHADQQTAIDALIEIHQSGDHNSVERISLPTGPAVAVVDEDPQYLQVGDDSIPLLQRRVTAWIPDRQGTTIAAISAATNSWPDWEHVCQLALEIFRSLAWTSG
jgi:hypothetical protein